MSESFITKLSQLSLIDTRDIAKDLKTSKILKFAELKEQNPQWTKKEICANMGVSPATISRIQKDLSIPSFYRYKHSSKKRVDKSGIDKSGIDKSEIDKSGIDKPKHRQKIARKQLITGGDLNELSTGEFLNQKYGNS